MRGTSQTSPSWPSSSSRRRPRSSAGASKSGFRGRCGLGVEEPCFVCEHDRLDAVAQIELLEDVRDVRLHGRVADVELLADLGVRQAPRDQAEHLELALGQLVE